MELVNGDGERGRLCASLHRERLVDWLVNGILFKLRTWFRFPFILDIFMRQDESTCVFFLGVVLPRQGIKNNATSYEFLLTHIHFLIILFGVSFRLAVYSECRYAHNTLKTTREQLPLQHQAAHLIQVKSCNKAKLLSFISFPLSSPHLTYVRDKNYGY